MSPAAVYHRLLTCQMLERLFNHGGADFGRRAAEYFLGDVWASALMVREFGLVTGNKAEITRGYAHIWVAKQASKEMERLRAQRAARLRHPAGKGLVAKIPAVRLPRQREEVSA